MIFSTLLSFGHGKNSETLTFKKISKALIAFVEQGIPHISKVILQVVGFSSKGLDESCIHRKECRRRREPCGWRVKEGGGGWRRVEESGGGWRRVEDSSMKQEGEKNTEAAPVFTQLSYLQDFTKYFNPTYTFVNSVTIFVCTIQMCFLRQAQLGGHSYRFPGM